jgi:hypothetical protein
MTGESFEEFLEFNAERLRRKLEELRVISETNLINAGVDPDRAAELLESMSFANERHVAELLAKAPEVWAQMQQREAAGRASE